MIENSQEKSTRYFGLDNLRAFAILWVMLFHYKYFVSNVNDFGLLSDYGWIGVDLFFVLSGFLISEQIFKKSLQQDFSFKVFYLKRFFKTLPNYYFVLLLYFMIPHFAEIPITKPLWHYLIFIQNFGLQVSGFSQSWSLCVEEQFYLLFPLFVIIIFKLSRKIFIPCLFTLVVLGIIIRMELFKDMIANGVIKNYITVIYYVTYCRLDGFIFGVLLAYFKSYHKEQFGSIQNRYNYILLLSGVVLFIFALYLVYDRKSYLTATIGYPYLSFSIMLIVAAAINNKSILAFNSIVLQKIALWSYSIYLVQKPVSVIFANIFLHYRLNNLSYLIILINMLIQIMAGVFLFYLVENNFMKIRTRILKNIPKNKLLES